METEDLGFPTAPWRWEPRVLFGLARIDLFCGLGLLGLGWRNGRPPPVVLGDYSLLFFHPRHS